MRAMRANSLQRRMCVALLGGALLVAGCETPTSRARSAGELLSEADPAVASSRSPVRAIAEREAVVASEPLAVGEGVAPAPPVQTMQTAVVATLAPALAPQASPVAVGERTSRIELAGKDVFEAGSWVLTPGSAALLRQQMSRLPRERPLAIAVFNQPTTARVNRSGKVLRDLSEVRAEKLAEYLRSPEGGAWTIERAVGRGFDVVDGRAADRRVEIYVAE
ncbi:MAG: hypothetical protein K2W85_05625 [Phycisphaerales bacterium]|nr:hypothetical protein [Phycisphaerales bacterium]